MMDERFRSWAILELMGHRKLAGEVSDVEMFGVRMCRIDIPSEPPVTQYYGGGSIYCMTPTTEQIARAYAATLRPAPVHVYELPSLPRPAVAVTDLDEQYHSLCERPGLDADLDLGRIEEAAGTDASIPNDAGADVVHEFLDRGDLNARIDEPGKPSLGTPEAVALREQTPPEVAAAIVERSGSFACPHGCTHSYSEPCPHDCSCSACEMPF